jgi:hypothetical protein
MTVSSTEQIDPASAEREERLGKAPGLARRSLREDMPMPRWPGVVRILRRTHLFAGLALCPWVALYGLTALLFNHPTLAAGSVVRAARPIGHVGRAKVPSAASLAVSLVDSLNAGAGGRGVAYRLVDPDSAVSSGGVQFLMTVGDTVYRVSYDARDGTITGRPTAGESKLDPRNFLTALHKTRGYSNPKAKGRADGRAPQSSGARWGWAFVVDAVGLLMLFWVCSGLAMWWQVRALRVAGGLVLATSVIVATVLIASLHRALIGG